MTGQTELALPAARCCFPAGGVPADAADSRGWKMCNVLVKEGGRNVKSEERMTQFH